MNLKDLGLDPQSMIAGFGGGTVHAIAFKQTAPWAVFGSVFAGAIVANYMGPEIAKMLHLEPGATAAAAFIAGLSAMALAQGFVAVVEKYLASAESGKPEGGKP